MQSTERENTGGKVEDELSSEKNALGKNKEERNRNDKQEFFEDDLYVWNLLLLIDNKNR